MTTTPQQIPLTKSAIRNKAINFSKTWAEASSEKSESQSFWNAFFEIFGVSPRNKGYFEVAAEKLSTGGHGYIDLLIPGEMAVEQKSAGGDLNKAMSQLVDYLDSLQPGAMPRLLVACDFQRFYVQNLDTKKRHEFDLSELSANIELFWWLGGHREVDTFVDEEEANLKATAYMADIHDAVLASGYDPHALREWLTRILFCLFADDTEVWDRSAFTNYLFLNTKPDGSDLGSQLQYLFQILNTPDEKRASTIDEDLAAFTYINGDLFSETLPIPSCDEKVRLALVEACKFNWSEISPAIFGSMFQNVMTAAERRHLGAHYTTEENILKTIRPLFLDDLEAELAAIKVSKSKLSSDRLSEFQTKLASLKFLDPACGCGNFLVIAYRELRRLEVETIRKRAIARGVAMDATMDVAHDLKVTVDQFYGIELEEFPARIARTALYLMDHKENLAFSKEFGQYFARFPIPSSPHIAIANALRIDWNEVLPAEDCSFVMGNPPFVGKQQRTISQQEDMYLVFGAQKGSGVLDYVAAWYNKAVNYIGTLPVEAAFVSTNSITQGEQVPIMWSPIFENGFEITFAHRTFAWESEAHGKAHVHCVIVGFAPASDRRKRKTIFEYPDINGEPVLIRAKQINAYLVDAPVVVVLKRSSPLVAKIPSASFGSMPNDGGGLIVSSDEADGLRGPSGDPVAARLLRRLVGAEDLINGGDRWCLWLHESTAYERSTSAFIRHRLSKVKSYRLASKRVATRELAKTPHLFGEDRQPRGQYLCLPRHSSERRRTIPMAYCRPDLIAHDSTLTIDRAPIWIFGILQSQMFMAWVRTVSGRLESRFRISVSNVYNTFPFPDVTDELKLIVEPLAQALLDAICSEPGGTLAQLHDPLTMPPNVVKALDRLDKAVDELFAPRKNLTSDAERLEVLFQRYAVLAKQ